MKYDIFHFTSSLVRKQYLPFLAQKLERKKMSKPVSGYYKTKKKVAWTTKKNTFFMCIFPKKQKVFFMSFLKT